MSKLDKIYDVYKAEFELIKQQSGILLQAHNNGFNGEMKEAGFLVEIFVKDLIKKYLPFGYRICSGYIATPDSLTSDVNLIQHDVIIVDARIPAIFKFPYADVEIVPAESVCGIIEVKRSLNKPSLKNAIQHLSFTAKQLESNPKVNKSKFADSSVCSTTMNIATTAPFYGIIGLQHDQELNDYMGEELIQAEHEFLDIIWSISTPYLRGLVVKEGGIECFAQNTARDNQNGLNHVRWISTEEDDLVACNFARAISRLQIWICNTSKSNWTSDAPQMYLGLK